MSIQTAEAEYNSRMAVVRSSFIARVIREFDVLQDLLDAARAGQNPAKELTEAKFLTHRLYGVAGSVGFPELGQCLRRIELRIQQGEQQFEPTEDILADVDRIAGSVRAAFRKTNLANGQMQI